MTYWQYKNEFFGDTIRLLEGLPLYNAPIEKKTTHETA